MNEVQNEVSIVTYTPELALYFKQLNIAWIEKYFKVEEHDLEQLDNPEHYIIDNGGEILFAEYDCKIVGTCALVKTGEGEYELAKMAVAEDLRGKQIGKKLGVAAVEWTNKSSQYCSPLLPRTCVRYPSNFNNDPNKTRSFWCNAVYNG